MCLQSGGAGERFTHRTMCSLALGFKPPSLIGLIGVKYSKFRTTQAFVTKRYVSYASLYYVVANIKGTRRDLTEAYWKPLSDISIIRNRSKASSINGFMRRYYFYYVVGCVRIFPPLIRASAWVEACDFPVRSIIQTGLKHHSFGWTLFSFTAFVWPHFLIVITFFYLVNIALIG